MKSRCFVVSCSLILIGLWCILYSGCNSSSGKPIPINLGGRLVVKKFSDSKPGSLDHELELASDNELREALDAWLSKGHSKQSSMTSYVPKLIVESDLTMVNFVKDTVVLSVRRSKRDVWTQYEWTGNEDAKELQAALEDLFQTDEGK